VARRHATRLKNQWEHSAGTNFARIWRLLGRHPFLLSILSELRLVQNQEKEQEFQFVLSTRALAHTTQQA
jgi:hypothetical protein